MKKAFPLIFVFAILLTIAACSGSETKIRTGAKDISLYTDYDYSSNTIEKGSEYSIGYDNYDMYVATAISDKLIRIVKWSKDSSDDSFFEEDGEVGIFQIDDAQNGFVWADEAHTAFYFNLGDANKKDLRTKQIVTFSVLGTPSDQNKGTNFDKNAISYLYEYNDSYFYRALPLTQTTMKLEAWRRVEGFLWDTDVYAHDVVVINTEKTTTDFTWTDDEHTSFAITMHDPESGGYWKEEKLVYFIVENEKLLPPKNDMVSKPENDVSTTEENTVNITIDCEANFIFNTYGLSVWLDGKQIGTVNHGKNATFQCNISDGNHTLIVTKISDNTVEGRVTFTIADNSNFEYKVQCHADRVDIKQTYFENMRPLEAHEIKIPNNSSYYSDDTNCQTIYAELKSAGFTNIEMVAIYDLESWQSYDIGDVVSVSIGGKTTFEAKEIVYKDTKVIITYHDLKPIENDGTPPSDTSIGSQDKKDVFTIGEIAESQGMKVSLVSVTESMGSRSNKPSDGNVFVICEFEIINNSREDIAISSMLSFEAYCDDYACPYSLRALLEKGNKNQLDGTVASNKRFKGVIGYEVPVNWVELEIHFTPDLLFGTDIVFAATSN